MICGAHGDRCTYTRCAPIGYRPTNVYCAELAKKLTSCLIYLAREMSWGFAPIRRDFCASSLLIVRNKTRDLCINSTPVKLEIDVNALYSETLYGE